VNRLPIAAEFRGLGVKRSALQVAARVRRYADTSAALAGLGIGGGAVLIFALALCALGRHEEPEPSREPLGEEP
jgi:hypothetical protein